MAQFKYGDIVTIKEDYLEITQKCDRDRSSTGQIVGAGDYLEVIAGDINYKFKVIDVDNDGDVTISCKQVVSTQVVYPDVLELVEDTVEVTETPIKVIVVSKGDKRRY